MTRVRGTYDRYDYLVEKRDAFDRLAALIERIVNPRQDNVVPLAAIPREAYGPPSAASNRPGTPFAWRTARQKEVGGAPISNPSFPRR
jgi:hypothetical protein